MEEKTRSAEIYYIYLDITYREGRVKHSDINIVGFLRYIVTRMLHPYESLTLLIVLTTAISF